MKLNKWSIELVIFLFFYGISLGQNGGSNDKLFFPIRPGQVNYLSGTMGEVRSTHFHAGIDIKTGGISGLPVYATDDGYVSRINIRSGGYGHAIYLRHPNGLTSVYGHLLQYRNDISDFVRQEQYNRESFEINLFPEESQFKVQKGDLIGLSGNTGSSLGPHLHFELRDENQRPVNPLIFGFSEVKDDIPPTVLSFALICRNIESRINDQFGRFEFKVKRRGSEFYVDQPILVYGDFGVQINAHDKLNGAANRNGVPKITMYFDGEEYLDISIDTFSFKEARHVLNYYDYETRRNQRRTFQKLYIDDGNQLPFYKYNKNKGIISVLDEKLHEIEIELSDISGNVSSLIIPVVGYQPETNLSSLNYEKQDEISTKVIDNFMLIYTDYDTTEPDNSLLYANRMKYEIRPAYHSDNEAAYLWDMRLGLPDSLTICDKSRQFNFEVTLPSGVEFNFYNKAFDIRSFRRSLYDTVYLEAEYFVMPDHNLEVFSIGDPNIPLANSVQITFKPKLNYSPREKYALYLSENMDDFVFQSNEWNNNQIRLYTRSFGKFTILQDTVPPAIVPLQVNRKKASFRIDDDLSGIKEYKAFIDGKWLLMHYDPKRNYIWSVPLKPNNPITGEFILYVEDQVGNSNEFKTTIN